MRLRLKYGKSGTARFLSQLEVMRALMRAARRAGLPLALTSGFSPHPRMSFGPALAVGAESDAEYVDIELTEELEPEDVLGALERELPSGLKVLGARKIASDEPPVAAVVRCAAYEVQLKDSALPGLELAVDRFLEQQEVWVLRKTKDGFRKINVRAGVYALKLKEGTVLEMVLSLGPEGSVRPEEVVRALDPSWEIKNIRRTALFVSCGPERFIPLA